MSEYQLQIKQVVDYPRCRIYRQFVQSLITDQSIRTGGGSGLFYYTVLCSNANFRTSYRRIDGISYTIYPGEWICTVKELVGWFRTHFQHQALDILDELQKRNLISYLALDRGKVIKYKIRDWKNHNTVLDYNCPCQKDTGFFFMPVTTAMELVGAGRCSEMDILLDLWLSTVYNDKQVQGSEAGPVVYLRNGTGCPLVNYNELAARWGISKATAGRVLKKFDKLDYISLMAFSGTKGSVIYLKNYLSTMFQISDVLIDKEEVAMVLNIRINLPEENSAVEDAVTLEPEVCVSEELSSVSKTHIGTLIEKMAEILDSQGVSCFRCAKAKYKLYPLSDDWEGKYLYRPREASGKHIGMVLYCGNESHVYTFEMILLPVGGKEKEDYHNEECRFWEVRRAIFDNKGYGLRAYYWGDYKHATMRWIKTDICSSYTQSYYYYYRIYDGRVYGRTLPDLAKKELRKTGLVETIATAKEIDPEKYLAVWKSVPELERLAKAGLGTLVKELMYGRCSNEECFKNRLYGDLKKMLGIDSQELARMRRCNGGSSFLKWLQYEKMTGKLLPDHVISWFCHESITADDLKFISDRMSMVQIYNYVRRQMRENGMKSREVLTTWGDYMAMAERFHMDTQDAIVYRVRKLRKRHDELVERSHSKSLAIRAGEILKKYPHVEEIYESIKGIYEYSDGNYSVISPCCIEDVLREGENLHHCVDSSDRYWERTERKETYIMFLRRSEEVEKAYYTLEIEPDGAIRQKRTMYDRQEKDIDDARKFLKKWQKIVAERIGDEERELARISRSLRKQEFAEMREKQLIIRTGELSGRLLVDVLTEDLMEAA